MCKSINKKSLITKLHILIKEGFAIIVSKYKFGNKEGKKMSTYKNQTIIQASAEDIFSVFLDSIKQDFSNFNEETAVGSAIKKAVSGYSMKTGQVEVEIKVFEKNKVYEIQSTSSHQVFTSRYELEALDINKTKLTVTEIVVTQGMLGIFNDMLVKFVFKKGIKECFEHMVTSLNTQLNHKISN